jgi:hypothetical protein
MILKNILSASAMANIATYVSNLINDLIPSQIGNANRFLTTSGSVTSWANVLTPVNTTKTATGSSTATLNWDSGVITFTQIISPASSSNFRLNNLLLFTGDVLFWTIDYTGSTGIPIPMYCKTGAGYVEFTIYNAHASESTNGNIVVNFKKAD